jgi:hypothetical protein
MGKSPTGRLPYATRLVNAMKAKAKPEGVSEADWQTKKSAFSVAGITSRA